MFHRIVGDNWDLEIKARAQSTRLNNKSLHYYHMFAVADRVRGQNLPNDGAQKKLDDLRVEECLPTQDVQEKFAEDLQHILPRFLVKYLHAYSALRKAVIYHIPHTHTRQMTQK